MRSLLILLLVLVISCAEKRDYRDEDFTAAYASTVEVEGRVLKCSIFGDDTFSGKVRMVKNKKNCFDMKILKYPTNFFDTENIFLQAYPFATSDHETKYGKSLSLKIFHNEDEATPLIQSSTIDSYLVTQEIKTSSKFFFNEHYFRLCGLDQQEWDAVQLVTYLRRSDYDEPNAIRITKFLLPPFLANPDHFKKQEGSVLLGYHPFFNLKKNLEIEPSSYYKISESLCNSDF